MLELPTSGPWTGGHVIAARAALGLTQAELADALELGEGAKAKNGKDTVRNWERESRPITGPARVAIRHMVAAKAKRPASAPAKGPAIAKADKSTLLLALDLAARTTTEGAKKLRLVGSPSDQEADAAADRFRALRAKLEKTP